MTSFPRKGIFVFVQVTIEVPDHLVERFKTERARLIEFLESKHSAASDLAHEMIAFLARDPKPAEIVSFKPSPSCEDRIRELLDKNRDGKMNREEQTEMDELEALDHFFSVLRAQARRSMPVMA